MEISGDYLFDVPPHMVWNALQDPNVLGFVLPGAQGFEQVGENQYTGALVIKVGPVQGTFQGQIKLSDFHAPESYWMEVNGKGAAGVVNASGRLRLEPRGSQTYMEYTGQAQVGGRIASVGNRLIETSARSIIQQSLEALNEYLKLKMEQPPQQPTAELSASMANETSSAVSQTASMREYQPPSQMTSVRKVARDIFNDILPAKYQPWLFGAIIAVILLIVWLISSR